MDPGPSGTDWFAKHTGAYAVPVDGSTPAVLLSDADQHTLDGHFGPGPGGGVLFACQNRGAVELLEFPAAGGAPEVLFTGPRQVTAVGVAGPAVAAVVTDPDSPGEVWLRDDDGERPLTNFGRDLADNVRVRSAQELVTVAPDGYPVHGWVVRPDGAGPHPVLLLIHGGPFAQYGWRYFDEAQAYAEAGYAVVLGNPRGSSGYGHRHGRYISGDVGARSAPDLLALLDRALAEPDLDGTRTGVLGGSHGGYMVGWLMAHTDRFRVGVSERAVNAIDSFLATSDVGWLFPSLYGTDPEGHRRQSPLTHADRIAAPLLIIHSEDDLRCPLEQGQRLFHALKSRGADVEMLVFPGEGHELSRTGRPGHRVARFEAILDWIGTRLAHRGSRDPQPVPGGSR
jgi:dipeptidyl aminopeptidase/acylaminoacyl peptidase